MRWECTRCGWEDKDAEEEGRLQRPSQWALVEWGGGPKRVKRAFLCPACRMGLVDYIRELGRMTP